MQATHEEMKSMVREIVYQINLTLAHKRLNEHHAKRRAV